MDLFIASVAFLVLTAIGIPIGTVLGIVGAASLYWFDLGISMLGVNFNSGIASFPLLAIPFFVLAGVILERAGLAATIARFFELGDQVGEHAARHLIQQRVRIHAQRLDGDRSVRDHAIRNGAHNLRGFGELDKIKSRVALGSLEGCHKRFRCGLRRAVAEG